MGTPIIHNKAFQSWVFSPASIGHPKVTLRQCEVKIIKKSVLVLSLDITSTTPRDSIILESDKVGDSLRSA